MNNPSETSKPSMESGDGNTGKKLWIATQIFSGGTEWIFKAKLTSLQELKNEITTTKETEQNTNTVITKQTNPTNQPETKKANNNKNQQIKKSPTTQTPTHIYCL